MLASNPTGATVQLVKWKKFLPIVLLSMVEAENFTDPHVL